MNISFAKYAKYYDQIYADKSYAIESQYISKILKKKKIKNIRNRMWFWRTRFTAS
jgi:hypothetical protein